MVKEYHNDFLHVVIDCKTGNEDMDKAIESTIAGYVYLVVYALEKEKMGALIDKVQDIAKEFQKNIDK